MEQDKILPIHDEKIAENRETVAIDEKKKAGLRSFTWKHFNHVHEGETEYAVCKSCNKRYVYCTKDKPSPTTGNQIKHLRNKHPEVDTEDDQRKFVFSQEKYRAALLKWIAACGYDFTAPQHEAFLQLSRSLNPNAKIVSSEQLKEDLFKCYAAKFEAIKNKLGEYGGKFSFTVSWTQKKRFSFVKIKAHWIDTAEWKRENILLDFCRVFGTGSATDVGEAFVKCLTRYGIPLSKVLGVTLNSNLSISNQFIDSLQNGNTSGTNVSVENKVHCLLSISNLAVQDILRSLECPIDENATYEIEIQENQDTLMRSTNHDMEPFKSVIFKLRLFIENAKSSPQVLIDLKQICDLMSVEFKSPLIDSVGDPNSTYKMLETAVHLKAPFGALCLKEKSLRVYHFSEMEWDELNSIKALLQKFDRATNFMSMNDSAICAYLPTINWLIDSLETFVSKNEGPLAVAAEVGLATIKSFELNITTSKIPFIASFLNPSLKLNYFKEHNYVKGLLKVIEKGIHDTFKKAYLGKADDSAVSEEEEDEFFSHMFKRAKKNDYSKEFQNYCRYPISAPKVNVLDFWKAQQNEFPDLSKMAQDYLSAPSFVNDEIDCYQMVDLEDIDASLASLCLKYWFNANDL